MKKASFLIPPATVGGSHVCDNTPDRSLSRRAFIKRTGGATVAGLVAWNMLQKQAEAVAPGNPSHCPAHGRYCTWVTGITVHFTSTTNPPAVNGFTQSGRIFHGILRVSWTNCYLGSSYYDLNVHSGGYRADQSHVTPGNDTTCPDGNRPVTPQQSDEVPGFPVDTQGTGRSAVEIHQPGVSEGCIVFDTQLQWEIFRDLMNYGHNQGICVHSPPSPVPMTVTYAANCQPVGNEPG